PRRVHVTVATRRSAPGEAHTRCDQGAEAEGERGDAHEQPAGGTDGARLGPLGVQRAGRDDHASRRRSWTTAAIRATATHPLRTAMPAHGPMASSQRSRVCWIAI